MTLELPEKVEKKLVNTYKFNRKRPFTSFDDSYYSTKINNCCFMMYINNIFYKIRNMKHETI